MPKSDQMPKIDLTKLSTAEQNFMKVIEKQNLERVTKLKALRTKNLRTVSALGLGVLGIYAYSIYSVKQETFLDDFDEPPTTSTANPQ